uniref:Si:ch73-347e22.4 n=2 Tax=Sinocyclocheilus anshuiensis TaxID=1608454 RepID=A0A671QU54_9TELE
MYGSEILDSAVKQDTTGCEKANQNVLLADHNSTAPKEDLITNDVNPPTPRKKCRMAQLELLEDTAETSQKPDHSCSDASQEEVPSNARINRKAVSRKKLKKKTRLHLKAKNSATLGNQCSSQSTVLSPEEDCTSHFQVSDTTPMKGVSNPAVMEHAISSLESIPEKLQKSRKRATKQTLQSKDDPHKDVPITFPEVEADLDVKGHQEVRRFPLKASKGKNRNATSLLNRQSSQDSEGQTDSVSSSVTESLKILSPQNNPKKSKQKKRAHINKSAKTPNVCPQEDMKNTMTHKTKTVKAKSPLKKALRTDDNETTLLDTQPSAATATQPDSVSNVGNEVESPVIFGTPRKSPKKKLSKIKCEAIHVPAVDQTTAQQSVLNALSESDVSIVQPTTKRFRTRKKLDKKVSHNTVGENCEPAHMTLSSVDSVYATETDYSGVSQQNTEKTSSKRRKTDIKFIEAQSSTTSQKDDVTLLPSEDFSSIVVSNPEETVKAKGFSRNKTNDNHLNGNLVEETSLLATVTQESSILPTKIGSSSSFRLSSTLKKPRKKTVTKIKNEAAEILIVNQQEDLAAVPSKSGANIAASSSQMTLKEKRNVKKAVRQEIKDDHSVALFKMQASTLTLKQTECFSTSVHSTAKRSRKMSDIKHEAVHTPAADQTMQQEIHPFDSTSATEMDNSDVLKQKKTKVMMKKQPKKATKCKTDIKQAISDIREQSTVQQENSVSNRKTKVRSEDLTKKCKKKRTSEMKVTNDQPKDVVLPPPASQSKDATQDPCIKTDNVNETAESHVENQVSITTKDVASPQSSLKKAKKTRKKQLLLLDEAGVMVTGTQVADLCKLSDSQTVGSQQPEKDDAVVDQKDLKATKTPKKRGRKPGRKKRKMACLLTQTIKEEEHKDICYDNRIVCDFQNSTQIQTSEISQRITDIIEEPVLKSRKSTRTQKINSGPVVENLLTQGKSTVSLDITGCHTTLGETLSSSMQTADYEDQCTVEKKPPRRGRPPSKKSKKQKLFVALATVTQESSILPTKIGSSSSFRLSSTLKKPRKKTVTKIKNEAAEILIVNQQEDLAAVPSKSGANIAASSSQMTLKEKRNVEKAVRQEIKDDHSVALFKMQASTLTLKQTECFSTSVHSTAKRSRKMSDIKHEAVHTPAADQTMQQEIHPFDSTSATEMDNSDVLKQKKTKVMMKKQPKKATKCKTDIKQAISDIREQSTVQQENSVSNRKTKVRSEDLTKKCKKKRTSEMKVTNDQPKDVVLPPPASQSKDATQDPCIKTDNVNETAESHVENQVSITTKDVASPQSSLKKAKKTRKKQLLLLDEAGVMVTGTQVADLCKLSDSQTVGSQQPEKDDAVVDQKDLKATKTPKKRGRKPGRKKRKMACLLTQTIKEEEHKDICYDNRIVCDFQNSTQIQTSEISQRITDIIEEPVLKSRKSTRTQKINSGPVVENLLTQGKSTVSLDITGCHTTLGETLSSSMQTADYEDQCTVEKKPPRRGRPPSKKSKKQKLFVAHLEDNTSPSVQISDLSPCQDSTESTVKAAASPIKQKDMDKNVIVTKQLGTDPSESLQSANDLLSHSIPTSGRKKGKNLKRPIRDPKLTSLRVSSRTSVTSVKGFQKADITSLPQNSTNVFNEEGKTSLPMSGTVKKQKLCEKNAIQDGNVLADKKIENKATIKVLRGRKRGRKKRKIKDGQLQRLKTQDCCEPAKDLLAKFSMTSKCPTEDQNNIVTPEKNYIEKTKSDDVEMILPITAGTFKLTPKRDILCSSPSDLSSNLMKEVKKCKVEDSFEVSVQSYTDNTGGVSRGICNLISSNVVKEESEQISLDTKLKPNIELKCTREADGLSVETSGEKVLDNPPEPENAFQPSTDWKEDSFTQDSEDCVVMPNKVTNNRTIRSKPKEIKKKPLTCKYCGVSFRHITAYTIHQRVHTGNKPYKCKICGKTFSQLSKLKSHHNVHKQDTSFPCPCCSQRFLQKDDLLCHFKVHLQESKANSEPQKHIKSKRNTSSNVSSETPNNCGCLVRKKNFVKRVKLQDHMQVHEVEKPLTCKDCGKTFWKQSSLIAHEKTHWPVKPYACSICGKGFNQLKALKKHSQDHAGETPFSCFHCGHGFSALSALRMHQASKTCIARRNDEASSNIEGFIVSQGVDGQVNTPVFFKCQICKQLFRKWCQYTLHLQTHTSSPPYICFSCGQCYEKDSEMNVHCEVCCQSSGEEKICCASLAEILQSVTQIYPLKCTSSQSVPSTGFQLNSQTPTRSEQLPQLPRSMDVEPTQTRDTDLSKLPKTYSAHSPIKLPNAQSPARSDVNCTSPSSSIEWIEITQSIWKFKCSRCGQRFERYRDLSAHLQTHAPGFRYTCAHCGQFFERWSKLWLHQQRHRLKSRCYSCTQCNLQFRFFSSFREHMIDHAGQRPYACPLCPKTFIHEASLHAHQCESHKLCKSLKCDVCSKTFSSLTNLIKHSLLHNGSTSHICLLCNLSFTNTRVLKKHLKTHTTHHGPALPDIPSKPLDFPHKCKRCKASFSTGDLLYAHQIRHSRDAKTRIRPAVLPTSKLSDSCCNDTPSSPPSTHRNHISNLKLDGIPNDDSLYVYSHPDKLYVSPSHRVQLPVINLDPDEPEVSDSQNPGPELPNSEITSQSDSTHLPQATSDQETTNLNSSESIKMMANGQQNYSLNCQRSPTFVETSVDMEVEQPTQEEESEESFECADCTEKLTSVLGLYEHYILHAMGDAYVQVH